MIYELPNPFLPWLWPSLEIAGIVIQLGAVVLKRNWIFAPGLMAVALGAWVERDIALFTGDVCICAALWASRQT